MAAKFCATSNGECLSCVPFAGNSLRPPSLRLTLANCCCFDTARNHGRISAHESTPSLLVKQKRGRKIRLIYYFPFSYKQRATVLFSPSVIFADESRGIHHLRRRKSDDGRSLKPMLKKKVETVNHVRQRRRFVQENNRCESRFRISDARFSALLRATWVRTPSRSSLSRWWTPTRATRRRNETALLRYTLASSVARRMVFVRFRHFAGFRKCERAFKVECLDEAVHSVEATRRTT